jgi:PPOX class probable F420-dependent enzyme
MTGKLAPTTSAAAPVADFSDLARARAILLTTFRRDGTPIATPLWFVMRDGVLLATTHPTSGKAKRLRHTSRVLVAPCTPRGATTGPAHAAEARLLGPDETRAALAAIRRRYVIIDQLFSFINLLRGKVGEVGIAIVPAAPLD